VNWLLSVLPFDQAAAEEHARLRCLLRHAPIGERDLLVAAIASANELRVVTNNLAEFTRVSGLTSRGLVKVKSSPAFSLPRTAAPGAGQPGVDQAGLDFLSPDSEAITSWGRTPLRYPIDHLPLV